MECELLVVHKNMEDIYKTNTQKMSIYTILVKLCSSALIWNIPKTTEPVHLWSNPYADFVQMK
jgi:hypothetical protein